jgi:hypothetical protein
MGKWLLIKELPAMLGVTEDRLLTVGGAGKEIPVQKPRQYA